MVPGLGPVIGPEMRLTDGALACEDVSHALQVTDSNDDLETLLGVSDTPVPGRCPIVLLSPHLSGTAARQLGLKIARYRHAAMEFTPSAGGGNLGRCRTNIDDQQTARDEP